MDIEEDFTQQKQGDIQISIEEVSRIFQKSMVGEEVEAFLLAVSGGPDSIAMLGLAAHIKSSLPPLYVATVNHGLRIEAAIEAKMVEDFCEELSIPFSLLLWPQDKHLASNQESARDGRYMLLIDEAQRIGASHIVTAHTIDDQAETILLRIAKGTGIGGLGGMKSNIKRGNITHIRPFLEVSKARMIATCNFNNWKYALDPSNNNMRYARSRMRNIFPELEKEGINAKRLNILAERAARTQEALFYIANSTLEKIYISSQDGIDKYEAEHFSSLPFEICLKMVEIAILRISIKKYNDQTNYHINEDERIPLKKLENFVLSFRKSVMNGDKFRKTIAERMITRRKEVIEFCAAPPRRSAAPAKVD